MTKELEAIRDDKLRIGLLGLKRLFEVNAKKMTKDEIMAFDFTFMNITKALLKAQEQEKESKSLDKYEKFVDICRTKSVYIHLLQQCGDVESYNEYFINRYGLDEHIQRLLLTEENEYLKDFILKKYEHADITISYGCFYTPLGWFSLGMKSNGTDYCFIFSGASGIKTLETDNYKDLTFLNNCMLMAGVKPLGQESIEKPKSEPKQEREFKDLFDFL